MVETVQFYQFIVMWLVIHIFIFMRDIYSKMHHHG